MSGDEGTGAEGDHQTEGEAAADSDVEAAIEQEQPEGSDEPPGASGEDQQGEDTADAPDADDAADAPDADDAAEEPPSAREPVDDGGGDGGSTAAVEGGSTGREGGTGGAGVGGETIEVEVPANLLRAWEHQASKAKLSVSEYVVRMTEAGRMSVQMQPAGGGDGAAMSVEQLSDEVVEQLRHEDAVPWEQLVDAISTNLEEQLEQALERLQEDDVVRYSGLKGGYRLVEGDS